MTKKHKRPHKDSEEPEETQKPLKLVLKVGSHGTPVPSPGSVADETETPDKKHKHKKRKKHKDKKDRRRRDKQDDEDIESDGEEDTSPPLSSKEDTRTEPEVRGSDGEESDCHDDPSYTKPRVASQSYSEFTPARSLRERKSDGEKRTLNYLLDYLHKILSRKDVNGFFQFPVTDQIAPRYSEIIQHPMDFSTMRNKIDHSDYASVGQYKTDFRLMLENCMAYNHPDTIFHKEAQRLLNIGLKQLSKEKLMSLKRSLPSLTELTEEELGLKEDSGDDLVNCVEYKKPRKGQMDKYEAIVDDASPEEILAQVQAAARNAATELQERNPRNKVGYLKKKEDGATYLHFLNPDNDGIVSETERVVNIGGLMEKLKTGTGSLAGFREDKRNKAIPLSYLTYGPFSSYAPVYDSTTANLSKDESDLLLSTYGDEAGTQYSKSIQHFVENASDYAIQMVDNLLDILTAGKHPETKQYFKQKEKQEDEKKQQTSVPDLENPKEVESLRSLSKLGIDMSFLDSMDKSSDKEEEGSKEVQEQLNRTSELLSNLTSTQHQRLSTQPPPHLALVQGPNDKEMGIAEKLREGLTGLTKQAKPNHVSSSSALHNAMGVKPPVSNKQANETSDTVLHAGTLTEEGKAEELEAQFTENNSNSAVENDLYHEIMENSTVQGQPPQQPMANVELEGQGLQQEELQLQQADLMDSVNMELPQVIQDSNVMDNGDSSTIDQLVSVAQFTEPAYTAAGPETLDNFNISNGMDTSETEAAVANILG